jgi:DNA helicase-2/ATP-dependent DNA helicase PcrA
LLRSSGIGSSAYLGLGTEKRGSRRGIYGSGGGTVFGAGTSQSGEPAPTIAQAREKLVLHEGDLINHKVFGGGKVLQVEGDAVIVYFEKLKQTKKLLVDLAPIVLVKQ